MQSQPEEKRRRRIPAAVTVLCAAVLAAAVFAAGVGAGTSLAGQRQARAEAAADTQTAATAGAEPEMQLRVYDGQMEWYDGVFWHAYGPARELLDGDPFAALPQPEAPAEPAREGLTACGRAEGAVPGEEPAAGAWTGGGADTGGGSGGAADAGGGSGDGENIEWSGDVL